MSLTKINNSPSFSSYATISNKAKKRFLSKYSPEVNAGVDGFIKK